MRSRFYNGHQKKIYEIFGSIKIIEYLCTQIATTPKTLNDNDMKRQKTIMLLMLTALIAATAHAQTYIERLSRGTVAVPMADGGNLVTWRMLATDNDDVTFDVVRDGDVIGRDIRTATCFVDTKGTATNSYTIITHQNGATETAAPVQAWGKPFMSIPLQRPAEGTTPDGRKYVYTPNDCSAADVDGDGEYEIILKWDPSNSHDNSHDGYTGDVIIDCYKPNYAQPQSEEIHLLWRINLGKNIRAGAHYTQFVVYDFDGDGKAEMICKTAPGSVDGTGRYVSLAADDEEIRLTDNTVSYVNEKGRILSGPEYLTVFNGNDGRAVSTIFYRPNRAFGTGGSADYDREGWGDNNPGNRGERYLACAAFLAGKDHNPSAVMCRGYYTRAYLWAVDYDGRQLTTQWLHEGLTPGTSYGQGAHSLAVGDVDDDGCDEIIYGSAAIDHDGQLLHTTGLGHGDALHLADLDPDRPGLEVFMVHESKPYGCSLRDARTGELLYHATDKEDTGRGLAADIDAAHRGAEFWCSAEKVMHAVNGDNIVTTQEWLPQNFRLYWDGDLQEELLGNGHRGQKPGTWGNRQQRREMPPRGQQPPQNGMPQPTDMPQNMPQNGMQPRGPRGMMPPGGMQQTSYIAKWNAATGQIDHILINGRELSEWGLSADGSNHGHSSSCNGTKATPCLQADLFGDWREEIILYDTADNAHLNIFSTSIPTQYRVTTLMHDHVYRMGIVWQNVAYNQPPHLGYDITTKGVR